MQSVAVAVMWRYRKQASWHGFIYNAHAIGLGLLFEHSGLGRVANHEFISRYPPDRHNHFFDLTVVAIRDECIAGRFRQFSELVHDRDVGAESRCRATRTLEDDCSPIARWARNLRENSVLTQISAGDQPDRERDKRDSGVER